MRQLRRIARVLVFLIAMFFLVQSVAAEKVVGREAPAAVNPSLVLINSSNGSGIGVVIGKDLILTARHVVFGGTNPVIKIFFEPDFRSSPV